MNDFIDGVLAGTCSQKELGEHLRVDRRSVAAIADDFGLTRIGTRYRWRDIWRRVHRFGTVPAELHAALREPLLTLDDVATATGYKVPAFRAALNAGRIVPPQMIELGPRLRRWRRCDVAAWLEGEPVPTTPCVEIDRSVAEPDTKSNSRRPSQTSRNDIFGWAGSFNDRNVR